MLVRMNLNRLNTRRYDIVFMKDEYKKRVETVKKLNKIQEKARYVEYYENLEKAFNKIGLSVIDNNGNYLKDDEILALIAEKWDNWKE